MQQIEDPERAARLARAILSDVMSYNPEKVRLGIEHDDLFERLAPEIREARSYFGERVSSDVVAKTGAFDRALVDVLVYRSRHVRSSIW
jgi:hypothetical protein